MARGVAIVLLIGLYAGCRAPVPDMSFLSPSMDTTVPPPRTGAVGSNGMYYAPPTGLSGAPPAGATAPPPAPGTSGPVFTAPSQPLTPPSGYMGSSTGNPDSSAVTLASFQAGRPDEIASFEGNEPAEPATAALRGGDLVGTGNAPSGTASSTADANALKLSGMPVNDATEPAPLPAGATGNEVQNIANSPATNGNSPSFLRFINPRPAGEPSATPSTPVQPPASSAVAGNWQTR